MAIIYHHLAILWTLIQLSWTNHPSSKHHHQPPLHHPYIYHPAPWRGTTPSAWRCCAPGVAAANTWRSSGRRRRGSQLLLVDSMVTNQGEPVTTTGSSHWVSGDGWTPYTINHYKTTKAVRVLPRDRFQPLRRWEQPGWCVRCHGIAVDWSLVRWTCRMMLHPWYS